MSSASRELCRAMSQDSAVMPARVALTVKVKPSGCHGEVKPAEKVYMVDMWVSGRHHVVEKRYSEFEDLHKLIKKRIKTPEFPPKKVLKWNNKVLEHRRLGLENYLQGVVSYEAVPKAVFEFLEISMEEDGMDFDSATVPFEPKHGVVVTFSEDAYLQYVNTGTLPDIIAEGVTMGLFDSDYTAFPS